MLINPRNVLLTVLCGSLFASTAQAGTFHFGRGGRGTAVQNALNGVQNKSGTQTLNRIVTQTLNPQARPSLSTMDVIKAKNFASDVKNRVFKHEFKPSTMDVIKAGNILSDVKGRLLNRN